MQQEVEEKSVQFAVRTGQMSANALLKCLIAVKRHLDEKMKNKAITDDRPHGRQSVKDLIGQGEGVTRVDLDKEGIRDFHKIAKKYGVDYAIIKDKTVEPPVFNVFFKAKDKDGIDKVVSEYTMKYLNKQKIRSSVLAKLDKCKEAVKAMAQKAVEKRKERAR